MYILNGKVRILYGTNKDEWRKIIKKKKKGEELRKK